MGISHSAWYLKLISSRKGAPTVRKLRIALSAVLLAFGFGSFQSQFAQEPPTSAVHETTDERRAVILGLVRAINTIEVTDLYKYGSYDPWPALLERNTRDLNGWLKRFYPGGAQAHFGDLPEILPGYKLRLNVNPDGRGYVLFVEDAKDKDGFAAVSDESGIIRFCQYIG
jgi:hypothetical protein